MKIKVKYIETKADLLPCKIGNEIEIRDWSYIPF